MDMTSNIDVVVDSQTPPPPSTTLKSSPFTNGSLKNHLTTTATPSTVVVSYKECLKNHAASLGGRALDGCGEFMPSISSSQIHPRSLKCAACGCHRNFHRRDPQENITTTTTSSAIAAVTPRTNNNSNNFLSCIYPTPTSTVPPPQPPPPLQLPHRGPISQSTSPSQTTSPSQSLSPSPISSPSSPPPLSAHLPPSYHSSAPHMLLALGNAYSTPQPPPPPPPHSNVQHQNHHKNLNFSTSVVKLENINNNNTSSVNKKRYRTKFSKEQKDKMHEFSEKLGWRMQKGDDGMIQKFCNEIDVSRGVFKVWMHNNKNNSLRKKSESHHVGANDNNKPISSNNNVDNIHMNQDNCVHVSSSVNGLSS